MSSYSSVILPVTLQFLLLKGGDSPQLEYHDCFRTASQATPQGHHQDANASLQSLQRCLN